MTAPTTPARPSRAQHSWTFGDGEIRSLTGLRGCAAVMVMLYHFVLNLPEGTLPARQILLNGYLWVDLFFILSGFVMAYSQTAPPAAGRPPATHLSFLLTRFARIYPLYFVVLIETACLALWRTETINTAGFIRTFVLNIFMVQAWGLAPSMEGAAWSISTEWGAYLVFPLLLAVTVQSRRSVAWISGAAALLVINLLAFSPGPFTDSGQDRGGPLDIYSAATIAPLLRCVAEFTLGLLAFRVTKAMVRLYGRWTGPAATATMIAIMTAMCWPGLDVIIVVLFFLLLVLLAPQHGSMAKTLGTEIPYRLGQWSYSIYLIHDKFSHPVKALHAKLVPILPAAGIITAVLTASLVIGCSAITYTFVERPLRKLLLHLARTVSLRKTATTLRGPVVPVVMSKGLDASR